MAKFRIGREALIILGFVAEIALLFYSPIAFAVRILVLSVAWLVFRQMTANRTLVDISTRLHRLEVHVPERSFELVRTSYVLQAIVELNWDAILARLAEENGVTSDQLF